LKDDVWSVRINQSYRALGRRRGSLIVGFWIGTHAEYDKLVQHAILLNSGHLRTEGKHNSSSIRVLHLDVAALAMDFLKTEPLQCGPHLAA
jgi:hypothetical protein